MNNLLIISPEVPRTPHDEQRRREEADECPRTTYFDDHVATTVIDGMYLQSLKGFRASLYRKLPAPVVAALEAYRLRRRYDAVVCWDDRVALIYGLLLTLTRSKARHVAMVNWMAPGKKRMALRLAQRGIDRVIVWGDVHRELLGDLFGIAPSRITVIPFPVDLAFWRPIQRDMDWICAVGKSQRDYATLIQAMRGLPMTCRIVTTVNKETQGPKDLNVTARSLASEDVGANILLGPGSPAEVREIYARSRFVVIPLVPNFRDNGVTVAVEAMAMGKAIICSRTYGMIDIIEHGVNGLLVPPGDPVALREAIQYLWDNPSVAERMGAEGRRRADRVYALERFTASVQQVIRDVTRGAARSWEGASETPERTLALHPSSQARD